MTFIKGNKLLPSWRTLYALTQHDSVQSGSAGVREAPGIMAANCGEQDVRRGRTG